MRTKAAIRRWSWMPAVAAGIWLGMFQGRAAEGPKGIRIPGFPPLPPSPTPVAVARVTVTNAEPAVQRQFTEARRAAEDATATNAPAAVQAEAWNHLGKVYLAYRLGAMGAACLTNALVALPTHASSWYGLALIQMDREGYSGGAAAISNAIACLRADPGASPSDLGNARRLLADGLDRAGRLEEALGQFDYEHLGEPADGYSPIRAAQVLLRLGRPRDALRRLDGLTRAAPGNVLIRALHAEALQRVGQTNRAQAIRQSLVGAKVPSLARPDPWLRSVVVLNLSTAAKVDLGYAAMQRRRYRTALRHFEEALASDPKHTLARTYAAGCRLQLRELDRARTAFEDLVRENPSNHVARTGWAMALAKSGDTAAAQRICREWLARDTNSLPALFADAGVRRHSKDYSGAVASLRLLVAKEPASTGHFRELVDALAAAGQAEEAGRLLSLRLQTNAEALELSAHLARLLAASRQASVRNPAAALSLVNQLLARHGTNLVLAETRALALAGTGEWETAQEALKTLEPRVQMLAAARAQGNDDAEGAEEVPAGTDFPERFRRVQEAVKKRVPFLEPWPFADLDEAASAAGARP